MPLLNAICIRIKRKARMLSAESSRLTDLLLARQTLICRATELDLHMDMLSSLEGIPVAPWDEAAAAHDRELFRQFRQQALAEMARLPIVIADLHCRIHSARERLERVSPAQRH
jgi:hypothetical protein